MNGTTAIAALVADEVPATRKGEQTRARIIEAAASLLAASGYHDLKVLDVCAAARISAGTFYTHFKDRSALCEEVLVRVVRSVTQEILVGAGQGGDPFAAIVETNTRYIALFISAGPFNRALQQLVDESERVRAAWQEANAAIAEHIAAGVARRTGQEPDLAAARAAQAMLDGVLMQYFAWQDASLREAFGDVDELAQRVSVLWYRLLYRCDPPAPHSGP
ncbi:TetR/AcrR family transcriptional regulator [Kitasatospora cineracea]|uniref:TetR family transcriptional regulator n=1 Tax=Kitasatospora cineracea TaxID=88074 RepID=A0A8G1XEV0_9ACTN|nr:TetR/AcrR family transcriptional regulator [Kitasatospora cineracea]ROR46563.1 TetR family transcriptional regulator [Kitasatospora cineracea]